MPLVVLNVPISGQRRNAEQNQPRRPFDLTGQRDRPHFPSEGSNDEAAERSVDGIELGPQMRLDSGKVGQISRFGQKLLWQR